jgi:carbamoyltransferase
MTMNILGISAFYHDSAAVTQEVMLRLACHAHALTGASNLVWLAASPSTASGTGGILREGPFEKIWIQPAAGDAGGALGAALLDWHNYHRQPREVSGDGDAQRGSFLGPAYDAAEVLKGAAIPHEEMNEDELVKRVAQLLDEGKVIG